jgi:BMFP domain-containing protein YqiC
MQTRNRLFDDIARVASGAASALVGVKQEVDALVRQRIERLVADFELVSRDEFEAARATASNARAGAEQLEQRIAALEARLAVLEGRRPAVRAPHRQARVRRRPGRRRAAKV